MNTTKVSFMALALAATVFLGASGIAVARGGDYDGRYRGGYDGPNLTAEQVTVMEKLHDEFYVATEATQQQMILKQAELQAELSGSKPDAKKIEQISAELGALRGKMLSARTALQNKLEDAGLPAYDMGRRGGYDGNWGNGRGHGYGGGYGCAYGGGFGRHGGWHGGGHRGMGGMGGGNHW